MLLRKILFPHNATAHGGQKKDNDNISKHKISFSTTSRQQNQEFHLHMKPSPSSHQNWLKVTLICPCLRLYWEI